MQKAEFLAKRLILYGQISSTIIFASSNQHNKIKICLRLMYMGKDNEVDILWNGLVTSVPIIFLSFTCNYVVSTQVSSSSWCLGCFLIVAFLGPSI